MKTLKLIVLAILSIILSVSFSACNNDESNDDIFNSNNPLVGRWVEERQSGEWFIYTFNKDMTGKIRFNYTTNNGVHYDGWEEEGDFIYEYNKDFTKFRMTVNAFTYYHYINNTIVETKREEKEDLREVDKAPEEISFEIINEYDGEYILKLTRVHHGVGYTDTFVKQ